MLIGIDLDNTIIRYDGLLHKIALERGLIGSEIPENKRAVRDEVRSKFNDEEWQKLQIAIYGEQIFRAELMPGVWNFLSELKVRSWPFKIISHKTRFPNYGSPKIDLREAAMEFLAGNDFFAESGLGMVPDDVWFLPTRVDKINKIKELRCDVFIDDLVEVFDDDHFPEEIIAILFSAESGRKDFTKGKVFSSFDQIGSFLFQCGELS
ncbi:hypothetical protein [Maridesulfovibrio sp.]|uniref:hypothetical protein n=1 Tax=Maridesulfovibrio sp. TaxID=2795000 RepID=UPI002A187DE0|nr:hypothetical protein [Maridesulfovibrio sp.]